jgi:hypothetical protein
MICLQVHGYPNLSKTRRGAMLRRRSKRNVARQQRRLARRLLDDAPTRPAFKG